MTDAELNRLVGEKIFGYHIYHYDKDYRENCYYMLMDDDFNPVILYPLRAGERKTEEEAWADTPDFCNRPSSVFLLMDKIESMGYWVTVGRCNGKYGYMKPAWAEISGYEIELDYWSTYEVPGDTMGQALCLAALKLYEHINGQED